MTTLVQDVREHLKKWSTILQLRVLNVPHVVVPARAQAGTMPLQTAVGKGGHPAPTSRDDQRDIFSVCYGHALTGEANVFLHKRKKKEKKKDIIEILDVRSVSH